MLRDPEAWTQWEREWEWQQSRSYEERRPRAGPKTQRPGANHPAGAAGPEGRV